MDRLSVAVATPMLDLLVAAGYDLDTGDADEDATTRDLIEHVRMVAWSRHPAYADGLLDMLRRIIAGDAD
jgi:hypothetical protein